MVDCIEGVSENSASIARECLVLIMELQVLQCLLNAKLSDVMFFIIWRTLHIISFSSILKCGKCIENNDNRLLLTYYDIKFLGKIADINYIHFDCLGPELRGQLFAHFVLKCLALK